MSVGKWIVPSALLIGLPKVLAIILTVTVLSTKTFEVSGEMDKVAALVLPGTKKHIIMARVMSILFRVNNLKILSIIFLF